jgi:hypothetical protein
MIYPNILTIQGEGQNAGKTLMACKIIERFSQQHKIVGLKITPHRHKDTGNAKTVFQQGESLLMMETNPDSTKDTGRMLAAGATEAYLLQTSDSELPEALSKLLSFTGKKSLIVCESGKLGSLNKSGIRLFVKQPESKQSEIRKKVLADSDDIIVINNVNGLNFDLDKIVIENYIWKLKK